VHFPLYTLDANRLDRRFRWVALQLEELQDCSDEAEIRETLRNIPPTLEQTYERTLTRMPEKNQARVRTILLWLIYSVRPLSLPEVAAAAGLTFREDVLRICTSSLVSTSTGVIWIDSWNETGCDIVRLAHFSVQEYLCSGKIRNLDADRSFHMYAKLGHFEIGMQCVKELLKLDQALVHSSTTLDSDNEPDDEPDDEPDNQSVRSLLDQHEPTSEMEHSIASLSQNTDHSPVYYDIDSFVQRVLDHSPLLAYSILHWIEHAKFVQPADSETKALVNLINEFFYKEFSLYYATYLRCYDTYDPDHLDRDGLRKRISPTNFASSHGLIDNVSERIHQEVSLDYEGSYYGHGTALAAASAGGHANIVQLLLNSGADINLNNECSKPEFGTALAAASTKGHINIVQLLLKSGADVNLTSHNSRSRYGLAFSRASTVVYGTALAAASAEGHLNIVQLLLESGADVNLHAPDILTPLQAACVVGRDKVVPYLLKAGAEVDFALGKTGFHETALEIACRSYSGERPNIIADLLEAGADVNRKGMQQTALQAASHSGYAKIVVQLLNAGADPNLTTEYMSPAPLTSAIHQRNYEMVDQLLEAGADPNIQDADDRTPLWHARHSRRRGKNRMIHMLLAAGAADVDASDNEDRSSLSSYTSPESIGSRASSSASSDVED